MVHRNAVISVALPILALCVLPSKQDGFEDFVRAHMENYTTFLKTFDPSPVVYPPSEFRASSVVLNLEGNLSNHYVQGYSNLVDIVGIETNLPQGSFRVTYYLRGNITFHGQYVANGTILTLPLESQGSWYARIQSCHAWHAITFEVLPDGFLNIIDGSLIELYPTSGLDEIFFENLSDSDAAAGYEEFIASALWEGFSSFLNYNGQSGDHPIAYLFVDYWRPILAETTLADLIGFTTPPTPPTTAEADPTQNPCPDVCNEYPEELDLLKNTEVLGKTVEKDTILDANGIPVSITRVTILARDKKEL